MITGIEQNPRLGYYQVSDKIFYSKPEALIEATRVNHWPEWKFNIKTYAGLDWAQEPAQDLRELYRRRAQQLRDQYDYIRLECSGGSDSTTVAFSFLLNGIHLDEVIFRYPKLGEKGVSGDASNTKAENTLSEYEFAAKPLLHWIRTNFPNTVVREHDFSENMLAQEATRNESWVFRTRDWFQPAHGDKYDQFNVPEHRVIADSGKKICVLLGIEKPRVCLINQDWYCYFSDVQANSAHPIVGDYTNITNEYFYWTPDMPEITVKQAHMVRHWFDHAYNSQLKNLLEWPNYSISKRTAYESLVKSIIYPDYDQETWQTAKPTDSFYNEMDTWFYTNFAETKLYTAWLRGLEFLVDKIDPKFFTFRHNRPVGFIPMNSPLYYIGTSTSTARSTPKFVNQDYKAKSQHDLILVKDKKLTRVKL